MLIISSTFQKQKPKFAQESNADVIVNEVIMQMSSLGFSFWGPHGSPWSTLSDSIPKCNENNGLLGPRFYFFLTDSSRTGSWQVHIYIPFPFSAPSIGDGLKCYTCFTQKSWDECEKEEEKSVCPPGHNDVCIKLHLVEHGEEPGNYNENFAKMCGRAEMCTDKECKENGKYCKVDCCHNDFCNSTAKLSTRLPIMLLLQLLILIVTHFIQLPWYCG